MKADLGADASAVDFLPFKDLERSVLDDIEVIRASPLMDPAVLVHGYIYDVSFCCDPRVSSRHNGRKAIGQQLR